MRGVFALHNRSRVEVVVFALSKDDGSAERRDIAESADHFVLLEPNHPSPRKEIMSWDCDILLYLDGYVMRARPDIFARSSAATSAAAAAAAAAAVAGGQQRRPPMLGGVAKIQVACMYPSTLGTRDFDFHLGDHVVMPPELHGSQFTEELLELPYSYYVNDYARSYTTLPSREELPEGQLPPPGRFRFANFNQVCRVEMTPPKQLNLSSQFPFIYVYA
jgi:predicted O-linked N-acetylglucosamine transferase (SPINDLY family)